MLADDDESPLTDAIDRMVHLRLTSRQHNAAIKIKCINHIYPSDCKVMWQIDGKHPEAWIPLGEERFIPLRDLSYGRHRLTVRVMSNEAGTMLDERELLITTQPPFYLSFAGILLELLILSGILFQLGRYIIRKTIFPTNPKRRVQKSTKIPKRIGCTSRTHTRQIQTKKAADFSFVKQQMPQRIKAIFFMPLPRSSLPISVFPLAN